MPEKLQPQYDKFVEKQEAKRKFLEGDGISGIMNGDQKYLRAELQRKPRLLSGKHGTNPRDYQFILTYYGVYNK